MAARETTATRLESQTGHWNGLSAPGDRVMIHPGSRALIPLGRGAQCSWGEVADEHGREDGDGDRSAERAADGAKEMKPS